MNPAAIPSPNKFWTYDTVAPLISIVVPFYQYDPSLLAMRLCAMAADFPDEIELIFADDGSPNGAGAAQVISAMVNATVPCLVLEFETNLGRAVIRNQLAQLARGQYLLFMDCDMMPDEPNFIAIYFQLALAGISDIVYGGRSTKQIVDPLPELDLHRVFTAERETLSAAVRSQQPAYHFYSCNFLVRRQVILSVPIDERFTGWGWEDCEWAARASESFSLLHIDNPATHFGLLTPQKILMKYEESLGNFSLMLTLRPEMIVNIKLYKAACLLRKLHMGVVVKKVARWVVLESNAPMFMQIAGLMWFKAALYSRLV